VVAERGEKRDAAATVGKGVEDAVRGRHGGEPEEKGESVRVGSGLVRVGCGLVRVGCGSVRVGFGSVGKTPCRNGTDDSRKEQRVSKPAVAEHIFVPDAE